MKCPHCNKEIESKKSLEIKWISTPFTERVEKKHGWSWDGFVENVLRFKFFFDNETSKVFLIDLTTNNSIEIKSGALAHGFGLANEILNK
jgi:hypothetical protein